MDPEKFRPDFEILGKKANGKPIIYFDNACMTLKPRQVIEAINEYYTSYPSCGGRSQHSFGETVTRKIEESRKKIAKFISAKREEEIIFTRNATESINLVAKSIKLEAKEKGKKPLVLLTGKEHNSNLLPWLVKKQRGEIEIEFVKFDDEFSLEEFGQKASRASFVSMVHTSNLDGTSIPAEQVIRIAHKNNAPVMLDAAQSAPHSRINARSLDVDFLAFSGHKMLGPTGTGVLYGKKEMLENLEPFIIGGGTVFDSSYNGFKWDKLPERFEAGLQDYAGIIGMGAAADYLMKIGMDTVHSHEIQLNRIISEGLKGSTRVFGPENPEKRGGIYSFTVKGMDAHEVAVILNSSRNIMVRSGRHCVHSWFNAHNIEGTARASFYLYNTEQEAKSFIEEIRKIAKMVG